MEKKKLKLQIIYSKKIKQTFLQIFLSTFIQGRTDKKLKQRFKKKIVWAIWAINYSGF